MALLKIIKLSTKTWKHNSDVDGDFILTKFYAKQEDNEFLLVETYGAKRRKYLISEIDVYDIGGTAETFSNFTDLFLRLEALKYPAFYVDGESTGGGTWGTITGTLADQTDLQSALNSKQNVLDSVNFGEFMDLELPTKLTPSLSDSLLARDSLTNEAVEINISDLQTLISGTTWDLSDLTKYSIYAWIPQPASWYGFTTPTVVGTADNASPIFTGTQVQKATRRRYLSASTAGSSAEYYEGSFRQTCMGCGFFFNIKFAFEDAATVANARSFAGLFSSLSVFGNVNPSTQTNIFGVGADSGDTNLQLIHNDATGTATKVDLGINFPANTSATDEYLFQCYNLQGQTSSIWWRLINVTSMISTDWAEVTTDLPVSTSGAYINPRLWRNNGSTALAVRLAIMDMNLYKIL